MGGPQMLINFNLQSYNHVSFATWFLTSVSSMFCHLFGSWVPVKGFCTLFCSELGKRFHSFFTVKMFFARGREWTEGIPTVPVRTRKKKKRLLKPHNCIGFGSPRGTGQVKKVTKVSQAVFSEKTAFSISELANNFTNYCILVVPKKQNGYTILNQPPCTEIQKALQSKESLTQVAGEKTSIYYHSIVVNPCIKAVQKGNSFEVHIKAVLIAVNFPYEQQRNVRNALKESLRGWFTSYYQLHRETFQTLFSFAEPCDLNSAEISFDVELDFSGFSEERTHYLPKKTRDALNFPDKKTEMVIQAPKAINLSLTDNVNINMFDSTKPFLGEYQRICELKTVTLLNLPSAFFIKKMKPLMESKYVMKNTAFSEMIQRSLTFVAFCGFHYYTGLVHNAFLTFVDAPEDNLSFMATYSIRTTLQKMGIEIEKLKNTHNALRSTGLTSKDRISYYMELQKVLQLIALWNTHFYGACFLLLRKYKLNLAGVLFLFGLELDIEHRSVYKVVPKHLLARNFYRKISATGNNEPTKTDFLQQKRTIILFLKKCFSQWFAYLQMLGAELEDIEKTLENLNPGEQGFSTSTGELFYESKALAKVDQTIQNISKQMFRSFTQQTEASLDCEIDFIKQKLEVRDSASSLPLNPTWVQHLNKELERLQSNKKRIRFYDINQNMTKRLFGQLVMENCYKEKCNEIFADPTQQNFNETKSLKEFKKFEQVILKATNLAKYQNNIIENPKKAVNAEGDNNVSSHSVNAEEDNNVSSHSYDTSSSQTLPLMDPKSGELFIDNIRLFGCLSQILEFYTKKSAGSKGEKSQKEAIIPLHVQKALAKAMENLVLGKTSLTTHTRYVVKKHIILEKDLRDLKIKESEFHEKWPIFVRENKLFRD